MKLKSWAETAKLAFFFNILKYYVLHTGHGFRRVFTGAGTDSSLASRAFPALLVFEAFRPKKNNTT